MISIFSLIYRSPVYADALYESLMATTPELHDGRAEFYFVACCPTGEVLAHLRDKEYRYILYGSDEMTDEELAERGFDPPDYLRRVYAAMNDGIRHAKDVVVIISSDHVFTDGWLTALSEKWTPEMALSSLTIEPGIFMPAFPASLNGTGAVHHRLGLDPRKIDGAELEDFARSIRESMLTDGGAHQPVMISKEACVKAGLYPEGNPTGTCGDRVFFRTLFDQGVRHMTWHESVVYHIGEGEMRG